MILDTLILDNFAVYGGQQEILLSPTSEGRPIILFGGLNGSGKTTLLDAIQLAFYGARARVSNRGKLSYREYLKGAIHRGADPHQGASLAIEFRRSVDGVMRCYRVKRAWRETAKGIEETVEVLSDGEPDSLLSEHWEEYIESYIPSSISHLFFFDAEQIRDLAEGEHAAELLGTAIHALLGLDLVDRLETDLLALERRKRALGRPEETVNRLKHAQEEVERVDRMIEEATYEKARITGDGDRLAKTLSRTEERFRLEGGELFVKREELEVELKRVGDALMTEEGELRELAAGATPLLLVDSLLRETELQARREAETYKVQLLGDMLTERDADVIAELRRGRIPATHLEHFERVLSKDREARLVVDAERPYLHADEQLAVEVKHLRAVVLPDLHARIESRLDNAATLRESIVRMEISLARVPAEDSIATLQREIAVLRVQVEQTRGEVAALEAKLQALTRQQESAGQGYNRIVNEETEKQFVDEDRERVLKHSVKVRGTLEKFRGAIIRKHAARLERLMLDGFTQLLRKNNLVQDLKIDPDTFRLDLTGGDGGSLPFDRLSAGEKQLLATSLLWGLARASGRPLPTIIDTPLGRLDSSHRRHLVDRYFPVASHQVILLSTDEEIDEPTMRRLGQYIGRSYQLRFDADSRGTRVEPGYFWQNEASA